MATSTTVARCALVGNVTSIPPNPSASTLGGTESFTCTSHQFSNSLSTSGVPACQQPAFSDLSGSATAAQLPNPTSSTIGGVESYAAVTNQWINTISTSGVPSSTQPGFSNLSGALALAQVPTGGSNLQFMQTNGSGTGAWASIPREICGSSGVTAGAGGSVTDFVGIGALSTTQANVMFPSAITGTATALYAASSTAPTNPRTFIYTVMGGTTGGTAEAITCTISSTATACNDTGHTFAITAGDLLSVKMVSSTSSAAAQHMFCLKVTVP